MRVATIALVLILFGTMCASISDRERLRNIIKQSNKELRDIIKQIDNVDPETYNRMLQGHASTHYDRIKSYIDSLMKK